MAFGVARGELAGFAQATVALTALAVAGYLFYRSAVGYWTRFARGAWQTTRS
jgi:hypothetical protein